MKFSKQTKNNIDINIINTTKFKTTRIQVVFVGQLHEKTLTSRALMPYILKSVSKKYPKRDIMSAHLEELYASSFNVGVNKMTEGHIITFDIHFIDNAYTFNNQDLLNDALDFIKEVLYNPLFDEQVFLEEKRLMEEYFNGIYSNKVKYAITEMKNIMFKNDVFRLSSLGDKKSLETITIDDIKSSYNEMIHNDKVFISVIGNVNEDDILEKITNTFQMNSDKKVPKLISDRPVINKEVRFVENVIDVKQATLVCGYQFDVLYKESDYFPALLFNLILGGSSESLLFREIREKHSLVYYINSSYDPYKGVIYIYGGINATDYDSVMDKVKEVIQSITDGVVTQDTLDISKKLLLNGVIQGMDSNHSLLGKLNQSYIFNYDYDINNTIDKINAITLEEIITVSKKLTLDTIYLLRGDNNE